MSTNASCKALFQLGLHDRSESFVGTHSDVNVSCCVPVRATFKLNVSQFRVRLCSDIVRLDTEYVHEHRCDEA